MLRQCLLLAILFIPCSLPAQSLETLTKEVDAAELANTADLVGIPRRIMWSVAWEESRTGRLRNQIRGPGVIVDGKVVCREVGRMQLKPCQSWTYLSSQCTTRGLFVYAINIYCGALRLKELYGKYGIWTEAIRHYNGDGEKSKEYLTRVLATLGGYSITIPDSLSGESQCSVIASVNRC